MEKLGINSIVFQNGQILVFEYLQEKTDADTTVNSSIYKSFKQLNDEQMSAFLQENDVENYAILCKGLKQRTTGKSLFILMDLA